MERITATSSTLGIGRFSDGQALPLTASPDQFGSFADGQVARPTPSPSCASAASATDTTPRHRADQRPGADSATRRTRTRNDPPRQPPRAVRTAHARLPNASTGPAHADATARSQTIRQTGTAFRSECRQAHNVLRARPTPRRSQSARRPPAATCRSIRSHNVQALDPTSTREQCDAQMRQVRAGVARRNARHDSPRGADVRPSRLWPSRRTALRRGGRTAARGCIRAQIGGGWHSRGCGPLGRPAISRGSSRAEPDWRCSHSVSPPLERTRARLFSRSTSSTFSERTSSARAAVSYNRRHSAFSRTATSSRRQSRSS